MRVFMSNSTKSAGVMHMRSGKKKRVGTDAEAGPSQVYRMLRVNPAAGQAFCRFMVGRLGITGGAEPGSASSPPDLTLMAQTMTAQAHVLEESMLCGWEATQI